MEEKILTIFAKRKSSWVSGEEISKELGVSRTSVWKHMEILRALGYGIEAVPHHGYRLISRPDRLIPEEVRVGLRASLLGRNICSYTSLDSTNDTAYALAEKGAKEGTVVIAEEQKRGKGRQGRQWISPKGGMYISCIIRPDIEPREVAKVTLVTAVGVCAALREVTRLPVMIKWPNDIMIGGKKVSGILTEMKAEQDRVQFVIVGIGINVSAPARLLPKGATSLSRAAKTPVPKVLTAKKVLEYCEYYIMLFKKRGFEPVRDEWRLFSATLGKQITIHCHDEKLEGEALDVDKDGALVLRMDNGFQRRILSGDVTFAH